MWNTVYDLGMVWKWYDLALCEMIVWKIYKYMSPCFTMFLSFDRNMVTWKAYEQACENCVKLITWFNFTHMWNKCENLVKKAFFSHGKWQQLRDSLAGNHASVCRTRLPRGHAVRRREKKRGTTDLTTTFELCVALTTQNYEWLFRGDRSTIRQQHASCCQHEIICLEGYARKS